MFSNMTPRFITSRLITVLAVLSGGQAIAKEELALDGFTDISITTPFNLYVQQGDKFKVVVDTSKDTAEYLDTYVKNETLHLNINRHKKSRDMKGNVEYHVTLPNLKNVKLIGSGDVFIDNITSKKLHLSVQGSGDMSLEGFTGVDLIAKLHGSGDIKLDRVKAINNISSIHGSGDISASGTLESIEVSVHGSGDFHGSDLVVSKTADVEVFGSGDVSIKEAGKAKTKVHGSGDIDISSQS